VGILERSTNNNIEHQGIEYVTDCLLSWCRRWEERLGQDLLTEDERDELYFEFNLDALMRGDMKTRFEAYTSATGGAPWMVRNEVRAKENMEPIKGGDELIDPLNMAEARRGNPKKPPKRQPTQQDPEDDPEDAGGRAATLELQARRRVLNRETRALSKEWDRSAGDLAAFQEAFRRSTRSTYPSSPRRWWSTAIAPRPIASRSATRSSARSTRRPCRCCSPPGRPIRIPCSFPRFPPLNRRRSPEMKSISAIAAASWPPPRPKPRAPARTAALKPPELKNSHWCVHPKHGLGMIGEIGAQVTFHRYRRATDDEPAGVESTPDIVEQGDLRLCTADELPTHLGYTDQQLKDLGYDR
jgi:hypothetical protein